MKRAVVSLVVLLLMLLQVSAFPQVTAVPPWLNFQGRLTRPDGPPVADGVYTVTFALYDAPTEGNLRWTETRSVTVGNGVFAVLLGSLSPLSAATLNGTVYLQLQIANDAPLTPRQPLVTVAYAFKADSVK